MGDTVPCSTKKTGETWWEELVKQNPLRAADGHRSASSVIINKLWHALTLCGSALEICLLDLILTRVPGYSRRRNMGVWVSWICKPGFRQLMQFEERLVAWLGKFIEIFQLPHPIHFPYLHPISQTVGCRNEIAMNDPLMPCHGWKCGLGDSRGLGVGFALVAFQQRTACSRLGRRTGSLGAEWPLFQGGGHAQQGAPPGWRWKVKTGTCYEKKCLVSANIGKKHK